MPQDTIVQRDAGGEQGLHLFTALHRRQRGVVAMRGFAIYAEYANVPNVPDVPDVPDVPNVPDAPTTRKPACYRPNTSTS
ncbi:hypothetical protein FHX63_002488 [Cupriavidus plantarum]|nr:hypothetical protein [Cupriavidus plantarum]